MKKKWLATIAVLLLAMAGFAEEPPIAGGGWHWEDGKNLKGKIFYDGASSYKEQDGWAVVQGRKLHYWLYDTYAYHDGNWLPIVDQYVPQWIERMGYVIDFDNTEEYNPNNNLASSVKALMKQRGCDVSVALITDGRVPYVVINIYTKHANSYGTIIYYLVQ